MDIKLIINFSRFKDVIYFKQTYKKEKENIKIVVVAVLHSTSNDNSKGPRIGPSLFYASELHSKYNNKEQVLKPAL